MSLEAIVALDEEKELMLCRCETCGEHELTTGEDAAVLVGVPFEALVRSIKEDLRTAQYQCHDCFFVRGWSKFEVVSSIAQQRFAFFQAWGYWPSAHHRRDRT